MLLPLMIACGQSFHTENEFIVVQDDVMVTLSDEDSVPHAFIAGTRMCGAPRPNAEGVDAELDWGACYVQSLTSGSFDDEGCATFPEPGDVRWEFEAGACEFGDVASDGVTLHVVDPTAVTFALDPGYEALVEQAIADGTARGDIPDDWTHEDGTPWRVFVDGYLVIYPRGSLDDVNVAWRNEADVWTFESLAGDVPTWTAVTAVGAAALAPTAGSDTNFGLAFGGTAFPLGEIVGVDPEDAASLDLVVIYTVSESEPTVTTPAYSRTIVRDVAGELVYGANVVWEVDAGLGVGPGGGDGHFTFGPDYAVLVAPCIEEHAIGFPQTATLTVTYSGLSASETLRWTPGDDDVCPTEALADDVTQPGCGCASPLAPGASAVGFALVALGAARRRTGRRRPR